MCQKFGPFPKQYKMLPPIAASGNVSPQPIHGRSSEPLSFHHRRYASLDPTVSKQQDVSYTSTEKRSPYRYTKFTDRYSQLSGQRRDHSLATLQKPSAAYKRIIKSLEVVKKQKQDSIEEIKKKRGLIQNLMNNYRVNFNHTNPLKLKTQQLESTLRVYKRNASM